MVDNLIFILVFWICFTLSKSGLNITWEIVNVSRLSTKECFPIGTKICSNSYFLKRQIMAWTYYNLCRFNDPCELSRKSCILSQNNLKSKTFLYSGTELSVPYPWTRERHVSEWWWKMPCPENTPYSTALSLLKTASLCIGGDYIPPQTSSLVYFIKSILPPYYLTGQHG